MSAARRHRADRALFDQRSLDLETPPPPPASRRVADPACRRLWFCICLPRLPLEAAGPAGRARAIVEERQGIHRVLLADAAAAAAGVMPGQSSNAALALLPALDVVLRDEQVEQQALESLATWLERFSPVVCLAGRDVLLLEIAGSLRLYDGLKTLRQAIATGLAAQGFTVSLAIAPTPLASTWLARGGRRVCIREPANLPAALRRLPVACLGWPPSVGESLAGMGIERVGDCLRLPREGFARRFGPQRLIELDRALGRLPDPRSGWRAPERFCADAELAEEQGDRQLLLAVCDELLQAHERFLRARQLGTQRVEFGFFHLRAAATTLSLGCAGPERRAGHWSALLGLRFEALRLPEPVIAVRLRGGPTQPMRAGSERMQFRDRAGTGAVRYSMSQLAERLVARVGEPAVRGVATVAEHRPQNAWRWQRPGTGDTGRAAATPATAWRRPLWLLPEPARLSLEQGCPLHGGPLAFVDGPERLETGWWDEDGITRDYYTAVNPHGARLWVFRNRCREPAWFLHGLFG